MPKLSGGFPYLTKYRPERPAEVEGFVHQVSTSGGGVPKTSTDGGYVSLSGLVEDGHAESFHGGPHKALCLFSLEVIESLQAQGHPLAPGAAGENVTVGGIDWARVSPGTRWMIGADVEIEITNYTVPCQKNSRWFLNGDISQMNQERFPGRSRVYARVLTEGFIQAGDQFVGVDRSA